jgi:hypothetical protein
LWLPDAGTTNQVFYEQGTSFAAPMVAGAYAVLREKYPNASVDELTGLLQATGKSVSDTRAGYTVGSKPLIQLNTALKLSKTPLISNFKGPDGRVNAGGATTLTADVANASTCALNNHVGNVAVSNGKISQSVPVAQSYTLTCATGFGTDTKTISLDVNTGPTQPGNLDLTNWSDDRKAVTVKWTASEDSDGVAEYRVSVDGQQVAVVKDGKTEYRLTNFDPTQDHAITVLAADKLGALSAVASFPYKGKTADAQAGIDQQFTDQSNHDGGIGSVQNDPYIGQSAKLDDPHSFCTTVDDELRKES